MGYVGLAQAVLLAQHNEVTAVTTTPTKAERINCGISPIVDKEISEYMKKDIDLTATTDAESAYREAELIIIATPTDYDPELNLFNTYTLLIIVGTVKYIPFASRSSLNSMLQLSGEIEEAAIIQDIPWIKRMTRIIIPIQKSSIISGFLLPFMTCLRELSLFMLLCVQGFILSTTLDYFDEMGLYAFSSGINLILIITILVCNTLVNKVTGASLDKGIGG